MIKSQEPPKMESSPKVYSIDERLMRCSFCNKGFPIKECTLRAKEDAAQAVLRHVIKEHHRGPGPCVYPMEVLERHR
jgi:hypothetical protein